MANIINEFEDWTKVINPVLSWKRRYEEGLKQQNTKSNDDTICIGEVQIKDGKFFFVTEDRTYLLESIDQIKKIAAKALLKKKADVSITGHTDHEDEITNDYKDLKDFMMKKLT
jgi:outer membrane protein OmpA-like peptidoglycan-associated protein